MKKKLFTPNRIIISSLIIAFVFSSFTYASVKQNGSDVKFTTHLIDSNSMSEIAYGSKTRAGKVLNVQVTYMYDDNGNKKDNWKKTKWKIYKSGSSFSDTVKVTKGQYTSITMDSKVTKKTNISVNAQGNNSRLDAKISGYIYNFTMKEK